MVNRFSDIRQDIFDRQLSMIETTNPLVRYVILDCPTNATLPRYIEKFKELNVQAVVRCCQPTYNTDQLMQQNIQVIDLPFKDGSIPPATLIREWLDIVDKQCKTAELESDQPVTVAVHCVAGLGRAPVMVAIALIEMGMTPLDAIAYIRERRRGAFNKPQIAFLVDEYRRSSKTKMGTSWRLTWGKILRKSIA